MLNHSNINLPVNHIAHQVYLQHNSYEVIHLCLTMLACILLSFWLQHSRHNVLSSHMQYNSHPFSSHIQSNSLLPCFIFLTGCGVLVVVFKSLIILGVNTIVFPYASGHFCPRLISIREVF